MKQKLADDLEYLETNAVGPLSRLFFYIRTVYMIDNLVNVVQGLRNNTPSQRLMANIDPLGFFEELKTLKSESDDFGSMYESVLIDTPISQYFLKFLEINTSDLTDISQIKNFFKETNNENMRACLKRLWMEDFYEYVQSLNSISRDNMTNLLNMEADFKTIQVWFR
jgi:V-type H+-transporting ATPase subunit d